MVLEVDKHVRIKLLYFHNLLKFLHEGNDFFIQEEVN